MTAMTGPAPYRPPDLNPTKPYRLGGPNPEASKPWMGIRPGETEQEWQHRINHTCYRCGHFEADSAVLDEHEAGHEKRGR